MNAGRVASDKALSRRLMPLAWALVGLIASLLTLAWGALQIQLALAAFLNGESVWSKAQKQLVIDLVTYAVNGDRENLSRFNHNYQLLEFDRFARDETRKADFNYVEVEEALRHDNAMRDAVPIIIFTFQYLPDAPYIRDALQAWRSTDDSILQLKEISLDLAEKRHSATWSNPVMIQQIARIATLNDEIQPRTELFSSAIAAGAKWVGRMLFTMLIVFAALACVLWLRMAQRTLAGIRGTEERYRLLFDSAADAIVMVDEESGAIVDANRMASTWIGRTRKELIGQNFPALFEDGTAFDGRTPAVGKLRSAKGGLLPVEAQSSLAKWGKNIVRQAILRDVSERLAMEQERRIAAEALASVAEGVIIADGNRRVIAVNAAHTHITGYTAETLRTLRLDDLRTLPDGSPLPRSIWETIEQNGNWVGEVKTRRRDGSIYTERLSISAIRDERHRIEHYVAVFTDITVSKANQVRLEHLAAHDPLTGLVNRACFENLVNEAILDVDQDRPAMAVLFIDLDAFKIVNDSFSHAIGDRLLALVAERVARQLSVNDVAGRIGGDEFTVLVRKLRMREDAGALASRLLVAISEPYMIDEHEIVVSASIGVAGHPLDGRDAVALIANADAAMYAAKTKERNSIRFYSPMMHADIRNRLHLAAELRQALAREEFYVVYQPSVEMRTGRIIAVEALLRWKHPDRGDVMPDEFIPVAESLGLIRHIDQWVMQTVFKQLKSWDDEGVPPIRVALNVSANWFGHSAFVEFLGRSILSSQVAPSRVLLEITEGSVLSMGEDTNRIMHALHALGVSVAIDDFGTGYSSLSYLKLPAVAYLKIDRSFVAGLPSDANDVAISQAMLAMAKSLGLCTIAEGIETQAQHEFLLREGCIEGQGYLYSVPQPAHEIARLLSPNPRLVRTKLQLVSPSQP
ncbi:MAG: EAL domain-containing protein [Rudaea sp.]